MKDESVSLPLAVAMLVGVAFAAFAITARAFLDWRPEVSEWREVRTPYVARPIKVPGRITWKGVEYDCVLIEREEE